VFSVTSVATIFSPEVVASSGIDSDPAPDPDSDNNAYAFSDDSVRKRLCASARGSPVPDGEACLETGAVRLLPSRSGVFALRRKIPDYHEQDQSRTA